MAEKELGHEAEQIRPVPETTLLRKSIQSPIRLILQ